MKKSKDAVWEGKVIDKKHNFRKDEGKTEHFYYLVVETSQGKIMKIGLAKQKWDEFMIGDQIKKDKGSLFPRKLG